MALGEINLSIQKLQAEATELLTLARGADASLVTFTMNTKSLVRNKIRLHCEVKKGSDVFQKLNKNKIDTMTAAVGDVTSTLLKVKGLALWDLLVQDISDIAPALAPGLGGATL